MGRPKNDETLIDEAAALAASCREHATAYHRDADALSRILNTLLGRAKDQHNRRQDLFEASRKAQEASKKHKRRRLNQEQLGLIWASLIGAGRVSCSTRYYKAIWERARNEGIKIRSGSQGNGNRLIWIVPKEEEK